MHKKFESTKRSDRRLCAKWQRQQNEGEEEVFQSARREMRRLEKAREESTCIANSEVLHAEATSAHWHFAKTHGWPTVKLQNNSVTYADVASTTATDIPFASIRPLKLVVGTMVDVKYPRHWWRAVVLCVTPEAEHTAPRASTKITVTTLVSPEMDDQKTYIDEVELTQIRPGTSEPCKCFTGVGCFREVCPEVKDSDPEVKDSDLETHCRCNAGNFKTLDCSPALTVRTADPTSSGGYCKECDDARAQHEKARQLKQNNDDRHCSMCKEPRSQCRKCLEVSGTKEELLQKLELADANYEWIKARKSNATTREYMKARGVFIKGFLDEMTELDLTKSEQSLVYECVLKRWRIMMDPADDPVERAENWNAEWYDLVIKILLERGEYREAFCAAVHSFADHPTRSRSCSDLRETATALANAQGNDALETEVGRWQHAEFNGLGPLTTDFTNATFSDVSTRRFCWHQTILTVVVDAHALARRGEPLVLVHVLSMMVRSLDKSGARFGERIEDDATGGQRAQCLQWLDVFAAPAKFNEVAATWLHEHTLHDTKEYTHDAPVELLCDVRLSQLDLEDAKAGFDEYTQVKSDEHPTPGENGRKRRNNQKSYSRIDIVGVVIAHELHPDEDLHRHKRILTIIDQNKEEVKLTLWGRHADMELCGTPPILACTNVSIAVVSRTLVLSAGEQTNVRLNPHHPRAVELHEWHGQAQKGAGGAKLEFDWNQLGLAQPPNHRYTLINVDPAPPTTDRPRCALVFKSLEIAVSREATMNKHAEFESIGLTLRSVSQAQAQRAMHEYQRRTSAAELDRSCTCAVCGRMAPPTARTFSLETASIADLFEHGTACKAGFPPSRVRVFDEQTESYVPVSETSPPLAPPNPHPNCKAKGTEVEITVDNVDDSEDFDLGDDGDDNVETGRGRVAALRRDGTIDVEFDSEADEIAPPPCPGDETCPLRSQHHGFHAVEQDDGTWAMYCLLADKKDGWDSGRGSSDVVDTWADPSSFRACSDCERYLKKRTPELPRFSVLKHHLQLAPPVPPQNTRVGEEVDGRVSYWNGSRDARQDDDGKMVPSTYGVLPRLSLVGCRMIAAFKPVSFVYRLISSSKRDRAREASGKGVFEPSEKSRVFVDHDDAGKSMLQRATKGHLISFRHNMTQLLKLIESGEFTDACKPTKNVSEVVDQFKVQLIGPQYSRKQLYQILAEQPILKVPVDLLQSWLEYLVEYSHPDLYPATVASTSDEDEEAAGLNERSDVPQADADDLAAMGEAGLHPAWHSQVIILGKEEAKEAKAAQKAAHVEMSGYAKTHADMSAEVFASDGEKESDGLDQSGPSTATSMIPMNHDCYSHAELQRDVMAKIAKKSEERNVDTEPDSVAMDTEADTTQPPSGKRAVMIHGKPVNEFDGVGTLLYGAHPNLFPNARGYAIDPSRVQQYSTKEWSKYIFNLHDRRFCTDHSFGANFRDIMARHQVLQSAKANLKRDASHYDPSQLDTAVKLLAQGKTTAEICKMSPSLSQLMRDIRFTSGVVAGSPMERANFRRELRGLQTVRGVDGSVWMTLNLLDLDDPHILLNAGESTVKLRCSRRYRQRLIALDPYAAASWFHEHLTAVIEGLFGWDLKKGCSTHRGILGTVIDLAYVIECYGRGSLHAHMKIWVLEMQELAKVLRHPELVELIQVRIQEFVDSIVTTDVSAVPDSRRTHAYETVFTADKDDADKDRKDDADKGRDPLSSMSSPSAMRSQRDEVVKLAPHDAGEASDGDGDGDKVRVRSHRPPREFEGVRIKHAAPENNKFIVHRELDHSSYLKSGDLDHTPIARTAMVRDDKDQDVEVSLSAIRPQVPLSTRPDDLDMPAFGPSFMGEALRAHVAAMVTKEEPDAAHPVASVGPVESTDVRAGDLVVLHFKHEQHISVAQVSSAGSAKLVVKFFAHQGAVDGVGYDLHLPLRHRQPLLPEFDITIKGTLESGGRYAAARTKHHPNTETHARRTQSISWADVNVLATGFTLTETSSIPDLICNEVDRLVRGWDKAWGSRPLRTSTDASESDHDEDTWRSTIPVDLGGLQMDSLGHGDLVFALGTASRENGDVVEIGPDLKTNALPSRLEKHVKAEGVLLDRVPSKDEWNVQLLVGEATVQVPEANLRRLSSRVVGRRCREVCAKTAKAKVLRRCRCADMS